MQLPEYFDKLETRDEMTRRLAVQMELPKQIAFARDNAPAYGEMLADVDPSEITSVEALASLPVTRKAELMERQSRDKPFGGLATARPGQMRRVYSSPGPIYEPEGDVPDYWRMGRALFAAGVRAGDLVHNTFSYHFTPAGFMFESGAAAIGCGVFAAGVGQTELQVTTIADLRPTVYAGTPSFLKIILDKATEMGADVSSIKRGAVGGEALPPSLRNDLRDAGIEVRQSYGTADVALIAYESDAMEGLIVDENVIVEIVRPGTGDPVAEGEVGEVLVTSFSQSYPLVRFATGDMSAVMPGESPCGRTNMRIAGWMGRADQTTKVRGMFVRPEQIAAVLQRHPELTKVRLIVDREGVNDNMTLHCEHSNADDSVAEAVANSIREICKLRGEVVLVAPGSLANDGKVIDDIRSYE
jgi:phenylacetate-CoA ligase